MEQVASLLIGYVMGVGLGVTIGRVIMRRRVREHRAAVTRAWDAAMADIARVNQEARVLHDEVKGEAKRFRETFGIEALPPESVPIFKHSTLHPLRRLN